MDQNISNKTYFGLFHVLSLAYVSIFIVSNIAATKVWVVFGQYFAGGILFFPLLYILGDVITEVYGFIVSRRILWTALICSSLVMLLLMLVATFPGADLDTTPAYNKIFNFLPRILGASMLSLLIGEYVNSLILAITKIKFLGEFFGFRAMFSTMIGVFVETIIFVFGAFYGTLGFDEMISMVGTLVCVKVSYEFLSLPFTITLVSYLKKKEGIDYYDHNTRFSILPF